MLRSGTKKGAQSRNIRGLFAVREGDDEKAPVVEKTTPIVNRLREIAKDTKCRSKALPRACR